MIAWTKVQWSGVQEMAVDLMNTLVRDYGKRNAKIVSAQKKDRRMYIFSWITSKFSSRLKDVKTQEEGPVLKSVDSIIKTMTEVWYERIDPDEPIRIKCLLGI